jgi:hypothetical protein
MPTLSSTSQKRWTYSISLCLPLNNLPCTLPSHPPTIHPCPPRHKAPPTPSRIPHQPINLHTCLNWLMALVRSYPRRSSCWVYKAISYSQSNSSVNSPMPFAWQVIPKSVTLSSVVYGDTTLSCKCFLLVGSWAGSERSTSLKPSLNNLETLLYTELRCAPHMTHPD